MITPEITVKSIFLKRSCWRQFLSRKTKRTAEPQFFNCCTPVRMATVSYCVKGTPYEWRGSCTRVQCCLHVTASWIRNPDSHDIPANKVLWQFLQTCTRFSPDAVMSRHCWGILLCRGNDLAAYTPCHQEKKDREGKPLQMKWVLSACREVKCNATIEIRNKKY